MTKSEGRLKYTKTNKSMKHSLTGKKVGRRQRQEVQRKT